MMVDEELAVWPPETVETPMGVQPFAQAAKWHLPTILRDIAATGSIGYDVSGSLACHTLRVAANAIESLAAQVKELRGPDNLPAAASEILT